MADPSETGTVAWFDEKLGSGLIRDAHGSYIRVHYKDVSHTGHRTLLNGEQVVFRREKTQTATKAVSVDHAPEHPPAHYVRTGIAALLIRAMAKRGSVRYMWTYKDGRLNVNMVRYYLLKTRYFELYVHQFLSSDEDILHDHPWSFATLILSGGYVEQIWGRSPRVLRPGRIVFRAARHIHRVVIPARLAGRVWTLVLAGHRWNKWTFFDRKTGTALTPQEYAERRGVEIRIDHDYNIRGFLFPRLNEGTRIPRLTEHPRHG